MIAMVRTHFRDPFSQQRIINIRIKGDDTYIIQKFVLGYQKENKGCEYDEYGNYSSLENAKSACDSDSKCWGVYDKWGDDRDFSLCPYGAKAYSSSFSCTYFKPSKDFSIILKYL